jgi:hypothetical protein
MPTGHATISRLYATGVTSRHTDTHLGQDSAVDRARCGIARGKRAEHLARAIVVLVRWKAKREPDKVMYGLQIRCEHPQEPASTCATARTAEPTTP